MSRNRWIAAVVAAAIGLGLWTMSWTTPLTSAPAPADPGQTGFEGKVLFVRSDLYQSEFHVLQHAKVRHFGSHCFLVGQVLDSRGGGDALKGKTVWLNLASIRAIVEHDDADSAKKMLKSLPQVQQFPPPLEAIQPPKPKP
jgi:hypothetical protein